MSNSCPKSVFDSNITDVQSMIQIFTKLKSKGSIILSSVRNFDLLISSLQELDALVEMKTLKLSVLSQLKFLIIKKLHDAKSTAKSQASPVFEGHMLHSVIYGPPGVGKTKVGCILANIWLSLSLVSGTKTQQTPTLSGGTNSNTGEPAENLISKLELRQRTWLEKLEILHQQMMAQKDCFNIIQDEIEKLSDKNLLSSGEQNKLYTTVDDGSKYVDMCINVITEEFYREKPQLSDKISHSSPVASSSVNTDTLISLVKKIKPTSSLSSTSSLDSSLVKIVSRPDFVAEYLGQTAIKTLELLKSSLGKVLFIDEAYSLVNSDRDSYGMEALTVINQFMTEHPHDIIIILAGYKDMIEKNIFETQPGLKRRFTWVFEVKPYTSGGLAEIFRSQILDSGWTIATPLNEFFHANKDCFPSFGGDTVKLAFYCKLAFANRNFTKFVSDEFDVLSQKETEKEVKEEKEGEKQEKEGEKDSSLSSSLPSSLSLPSLLTLPSSPSLSDICPELLSKTINLDILLEGFKLYKENQVKDDLNSSCFMYV